MDRGQEFLKAQVNNAVMAHGAFVKALEDHSEQADDRRFRDLCFRFLPSMRDHQRALEMYQAELGADGMGSGLKNMLGSALAMVRDLADATRESDFLRLAGDIVMARQCEDTFKTFREAGKQLGIAELARIGEMGERGHDEYHREANRLVQALFVEHVRDGASTSPSDDDVTRARSGRLGSTADEQRF